MTEVTDYSEILSSICNEWDAAEDDIKVAEQVGHQVVFPSIKELRYGGRRIIDALNAVAAGEPTEKITAFFEDARFNCYRARHDAIDATIAIISVELHIKAKKIGYRAILKVYPEFSNLTRRLRATQEQISQSRADRSNREKIYSAVENAEFKDIVRMYRDFLDSEDIMRSMAQSDRFWRVMPIVVTSLILLASIAFNVAHYL